MENKALKLVSGWFFSGFILAAVAASTGDSASFPGSVTEIQSPNRLYTIKNVDTPAGNENFPKNKYGNKGSADIDKYELLFLSKGEKKPFPLRSYSRDVDVLWSPDSSAFIVNDWVASNLTTAYLYVVDDLAHPVDISKQLERRVKDKSERISIVSSDPCHIHAVRWLDPKTVEVKVSGGYFSRLHDQGHFHQFQFYYVWDLRKDSFDRSKEMSKK